MSRIGKKSVPVPAGVTGEAQHAPRGGNPTRGMHRFVVLALDRKTGKPVWERTVREQEPHEGSHFDNGTWASSSCNFAFTRSITATVLTPDCLRTTTVTAFWPLSRASDRGSSTPSLIVATSRR